MGRKPQTPPIQFTKDELRAIERGMGHILDEHRTVGVGIGLKYNAVGVLEKVRPVLYPVTTEAPDAR